MRPEKHRAVGKEEGQGKEEGRERERCKRIPGGVWDGDEVL